MPFVGPQCPPAPQTHEQLIQALEIHQARFGVEHRYIGGAVPQGRHQHAIFILDDRRAGAIDHTSPEEQISEARNVFVMLPYVVHNRP